MRRLFVLSLVAACESAAIELGGTQTKADDSGGMPTDSQPSGDDTAAAVNCETGPQEAARLNVTFDALGESCPWGENGNGDAENGLYTARIEQVSSLEIPAGTTVCGLGINIGEDNAPPPLQYDDAFLLTFDDVVLATSDRPFLERFATEGNFAIYDWPSLRGAELASRASETWCIGQENELSVCEFPQPAERGSFALSVGDGLMADLTARAREADRYDFMFVVLGDNDNGDCAHSALSFEVELAYVMP